MISVFTPTFNRLHTLPKLFDSLLKQTIYDFEWIVIDDDSNDGTENYFNSLTQQNLPFKITYFKQVHGGKHRAINKAVKLAAFDWFFIVDSDDYLTPDAIEKAKNWINNIDNDKKVAAVVGSRFEVNKNSALSVPNLLKLNPGLKCFNHERELFGLECDKAEIYRTELLKKFPFPEFDNEYFCTEAVVWDKISHEGYYLIFYPDSIYLCEYLEDGLTKSGANSFSGFSENLNGFLEYIKIEFLCHGFSLKTKELLFTAKQIYKFKRIKLSKLYEIFTLSKSQISDFKRFCLKKNIKNAIRKIIKRGF